MASRSCAWLGCALFVAALGMAGCRDLVQPAPPDAATGQQPFVQLLLESLDSNLDRATVTLDNSAYVTADRAGQWQAEAYLNQVRVEGAAPGIYDVHVQPVYRYAGTPEWTQRGVTLGEEPVVVAYPAVDVEVRLDWPGLAVLGVDSARTRIHFHYEILVPGSVYGRYQNASWIGGDLYRAKLPWEGEYSVHTILEGADMGLRYTYPEHVRVSADSLVVLASPLQERPMTLLAHGAPYTGNSVRITHDSSEYRAGSYELSYVVDRSLQPDSVFLLAPFTSALQLAWRDGPLFVEKRFLLIENDMDPGTVDLGRSAIVIRVTDPLGTPIGGARVVVDDSNDATTDDSGELHAFLDEGSYLLAVESPGFDPYVGVLYVEGDQETTIVLESE